MEFSLFLPKHASSEEYIDQFQPDIYFHLINKFQKMSYQVLLHYLKPFQEKLLSDG
jgi:hypothetical protein